MQNAQTIINDVTGFNPAPVWGVVKPGSVEEVQEALRCTTLPVSIGGGHFSMGGQTACPGSLHLDMRDLNKVLHFSPQARTLRVQAGIRWCDVQRFVDPHDLSVGVMQRYANFTVGGSLAANAFGRNVGQAPVVESVRAITLVLPNGERAEASATRNSRLFFAAIGGFGAIGVIVEVELALADNVRLQRAVQHVAVSHYAEWFAKRVRNAPQAVFHHALLLAPGYAGVRAETWSETARAVSEPQRLRPPDDAGWLRRRVRWAMRWWAPARGFERRIAEPLRRLTRPVHWRNYEAAQDIGASLPAGGYASCIVQTCFVATEKLDAFIAALREILHRHTVTEVDVQLAHLTDDPGCLLAYTRGETFAIELSVRQEASDHARERAAVWMRELIGAALDLGGSYHLPYQPHATPEQFHAAYPHALQLFAIKREFDPDYRLRSMLWDKYYAPWLQEQMTAEGDAVAPAPAAASVFHRVYARVPARDAFYRHLQASAHGYAEDKLHAFVRQACRTHGDEASLYRHMQQQLPSLRAGLTAWRRARSRWAQHRHAFRHCALELLGERKQLSGYVEIGTGGLYLSSLRKRLGFRGDLAIASMRAPGNSLPEWLERGARAPAARWLPLAGYAPLDDSVLRDNSLDMVCCGEGLHHAAPTDLEAFLASAYRVLRPGGVLLLCEHDVRSADDADFVELAHAVNDALTGLSWEAHAAQPRHFAPIEEWASRLARVGFSDDGRRIDLPGDHAGRVMSVFTKRGLSGARA